MGVLFVPAYIHLLGLESFGLVGFFVTLQALAVVFDLGLSGTVNRELARRGAEDTQATRDLVRTLEWIYWPLGAVVALLIWWSSGLLAENWLQPVGLPTRSVELAVGLMGAAIGGQWPSAFYAAGLNGLQRQALSNGLIALFGTLRGAGVLLPLVFVAPTVEVFFIWQAAIALLQSVVLARTLWRKLPPGTRVAHFSGAEISRVGAFTFGLTGIAVLSFALAQTDKVILSRLVSLDAFGVYALAASAAAALSRLVQPWFSAIYPRLSQLHASNDRDSLLATYHWGTQWLAVTVLPVAAVTVAFAQDLLSLWTRNAELAAAAAPLLALLVAGSALNGLMHLPYAMQLAHGWTSLALRANIVAVVIAIPAIWWLSSHFGPAGAAVVWPLLNLGYLSIAVPAMHRRILKGELAGWYCNDVLPPALASALMAVTLRLIAGPLPDGAVGVVALAAIYALTTAAAVASCRPRRHEVLRWASSRFSGA